MDMQALLASFNADQLAALKTAVDSLTDVSGRTPDSLPRQLHDLRKRPSATDPRPTFFWSAEEPPHGVDLTKTKPFPALLWHGENGQEITVMSAKEQAEKLAAGYVLKAPFVIVLDPMDELAEAIAALPEADRKLLLDGQKQDRINAMRDQLGKLPESQLALLLKKSARAGKTKGA